MNLQTIREFLGKTPFEPFALTLSDGERHVIGHPENVAIAKTRIVVTYPEEDRVVHVGLIHVNEIESIPSAA